MKKLTEMETVVQGFRGLNDVRCHCDVKIPLADVLIVAICALFVGYENIEHMALYGVYRADWFKQKFGIERMPSESTIRRVLSLIEPLELGLATLNLMRHLLQCEGDIVAIDGKAIRTSERMKGFDSKLRVLTALETESNISIGQVSVGEKTNEIVAMKELLNLLRLDGRIVTADAMHCQRSTCEQIVQEEGDYVIQVKQNQKTLYEAISTFMNQEIAEQSEAIDCAQTEEFGHGRHEYRRCSISRDTDWLAEYLDKPWPGIHTIIAVDRVTERAGTVSEDRSYYISSLYGTAAQLLAVIRAHWKIESLHWSLDVVFHEDACRVRDRRTQENLNILRKLILALSRAYIERLRKSGKPNTKTMPFNQGLVLCSIDPEHIVTMLTLVIDKPIKLV